MLAFVKGLRYYVRKNNPSSERSWFMLPSPVPADPGWDEDLAWLDRDPEREDWLARARENDEAPEPGEGEYEDYAPSLRRSWPRSGRPPPMSCSP